MKRSTSPLAKLIALTCVLALVLSLIPAAWAAGSNRDSGSTSLPKLSKEEITQLLRENPNTMPDQVFEPVPVCDEGIIFINSLIYVTGKRTALPAILNPRVL